MNQLNSIILEGNLVKKPEKVDFPGGGEVSRFTIGVNRVNKINGKNVPEVSYIDCEAFGIIANSMQKKERGDGVRVVGRLKQQRWEKEGKNFSRLVVVCEHVEFKPTVKKNQNQTNAKTETKEDYSMEM